MVPAGILSSGVDGIETSVSVGLTIAAVDRDGVVVGAVTDGAPVFCDVTEACCAGNSGVGDGAADVVDTGGSIKAVGCEAPATEGWETRDDGVLTIGVPDGTGAVGVVICGEGFVSGTAAQMIPVIMNKKYQNICTI
jgi:hypothetical protein